MRATLLAATIALLTGGIGHAQQTDCRAITDAAERLQCYDAVNPPAVGKPAKPAAPDPLIDEAERLIRKQLIDPGSARFWDVKIETKGGKKAVCGTVDAKNAAGGMTGPIEFVYDGEYANLMVRGIGSGNPTRMDADLLETTRFRRLSAHDRYCK